MAPNDGTRYSIHTGKIPLFHRADYAMFVLTLLISCGIGIFYAIVDRKKNTTKDFLLGGQSMHPVPVALSLMVTFMSAMTLLGNPAEMYNYNTMWWWLCLSFVIAMWMVSQIFVPFFYNLKRESVFEYLDMRFGTFTRIYSACLLVLQVLIYGAFLLYAPSLALNAVTGVDLWGCCIGMGCVVTFYTTLGGMKAVLWTDTFQALVIASGLLAVLIRGSMIEGGFDKAWQIADEGGRIVFDEFSPDPKIRHSVWSMVIGGWGFWMFLYGVNQAQVQRCMSCPSVKRAQMAILINLPGLIFTVSACCMIGIVMYAFYVNCDPIKYGLVAKTDQLVPLYVMDILGDYPGMPGVFVSCVVSGSLRVPEFLTFGKIKKDFEPIKLAYGSLSSGLNALTAVTLRDLLPAKWVNGVNQLRVTIISKVLVFFYGALTIGLAYAVSNLGSVLEAVYGVFGILNGPLLGVFTLGMFYPWANKFGAISGVTAALAFLLWCGLGAFANDIKTPLSPVSVAGCNFTAKPAPNITTTVAPPKDDPLFDLYRMSYMYYTALGMVLVQGVGIIVSFITGRTDPKSLDPRLICPLFEQLFPFLPTRVRDFLRFGIVHEGKYDMESEDISMTIKDKNINGDVVETAPLNGKETPCINDTANKDKDLSV